jgi:hypothetical protein
MFTRISNVALLLALAACNGAETSNGPAPLLDDIASPAPPPKTVCAVDGATELSAVCDRELIKDEVGLSLMLRHPGGGFRRLLIMTDGRGVIAADGSEPAIVQTLGTNMIEVSIDGDRYRLPATVQR